MVLISNLVYGLNNLKRNKMKIAVEWLWRWIMDNPFGSFQDGLNAYNKAKEMEKQQIIDAYDNGKYITSGKEFGGEQYYNETFKNK